MVARVARIEAVTCDSPHEAAWLERNLLETSLLAWNRTLGGQEGLVFIRMDQSQAAPGLTVEYVREPAANARYFRPYLGRQRVRLAVTGLHRILPLGYTSTGLRGAQLELMRARGATGVLGSVRLARSVSFADGRWRLVGQPEHDDARVTAGRVTANVPQAAVEGDQDPAGCGGRGHDVGVGRTGQALGGHGIDACDLQSGGRRDGRVLVQLALHRVCGIGSSSSRASAAP